LPKRRQADVVDDGVAGVAGDRSAGASGEAENPSSAMSAVRFHLSSQGACRRRADLRPHLPAGESFGSIDHSRTDSGITDYR